MSKDWTGSITSTFVCIGASNHSKSEREQHDYYATEPKALEILLEHESFTPEVWEPACGEGHLSQVLINNNYAVRSSDLIDRGYPETEVMDFLSVEETNTRDIITNPPYKYAHEFVQKALDISDVGTKVAMFLKLTFLEGKKRRKLFDEHPPKRIYVSSSRLTCAKNGDFERYPRRRSGVCVVHMGERLRRRYRCKVGELVESGV